VLLHDPLLEVGTTVSGWTHRHIAAEIRAGRLRDVGGTRSEERPMLLDELLDLAPPAATLRLEINGSGARDRGVRLRSVGAAVRAYSPRTFRRARQHERCCNHPLAEQVRSDRR
jgi:hypothetical protein